MYTIVGPMNKVFEDFWILLIEKYNALLTSHRIKEFVGFKVSSTLLKYGFVNGKGLTLRIYQLSKLSDHRTEIHTESPMPTWTEIISLPKFLHKSAPDIDLGKVVDREEYH